MLDSLILDNISMEIVTPHVLLESVRERTECMLGGQDRFNSYSMQFEQALLEDQVALIRDDNVGYDNLVDFALREECRELYDPGLNLYLDLMQEEDWEYVGDFAMDFVTRMKRYVPYEEFPKEHLYVENLFVDHEDFLDRIREIYREEGKPLD